jgi:hypothetical protein
MKRRDFMKKSAAAAGFAGLAGCSNPLESKTEVERDNPPLARKVENLNEDPVLKAEVQKRNILEDGSLEIYADQTGDKPVDGAEKYTITAELDMAGAGNLDEIDDIVEARDNTAYADDVDDAAGELFEGIYGVAQPQIGTAVQNDEVVGIGVRFNGSDGEAFGYTAGPEFLQSEETAEDPAGTYSDRFLESGSLQGQ